jgi:hypothetical protein
MSYRTSIYRENEIRYQRILIKNCSIPTNIREMGNQTTKQLGFVGISVGRANMREDKNSNKSRV